MHVDVRRTYKFRMYRNDKRDGHLHQQINVAGLVWNHALALQRRYYRLTGKYIGLGKLKKHIANLRMKTQRDAYWKDLGSQAVQDVLERLDRAYQRFFRRDFHFQLAHDLCDKYDVLVFETLNMDAMKRLWGRKVSDLGFAQFVTIAEWVAFKRGKRVIFLDCWTPTTQTCSNCGERQKLDLKQRTFACGHCGLVLDRDHNAAINIRAGASAHTARGEVRLSSDSIAVDRRSPRL